MARLAFGFFVIDIFVSSGNPVTHLYIILVMSRPQTPMGISPRGSYVNLSEKREEQAMFSPSKIEKERLRAEAEVNASLLREKDDDKKKEEITAVVSSPGMLLAPHTTMV